MDSLVDPVLDHGLDEDHSSEGDEKTIQVEDFGSQIVGFKSSSYSQEPKR